MKLFIIQTKKLIIVEWKMVKDKWRRGKEQVI